MIRTDRFFWLILGALVLVFGAGSAAAWKGSEPFFLLAVRALIVVQALLLAMFERSPRPARFAMIESLYGLSFLITLTGITFFGLGMTLLALLASAGTTFLYVMVSPPGLLVAGSRESERIDLHG